MALVKRQTQLFMASEDEDVFLTSVRSNIHEVELVDGQRWSTPQPPLASSASRCKSNDVYLWNRSLVPHLPSLPRPGGGFQGPTSGIVIQWIRCRRDRNVLLSGRMAIGTSDQIIIRFADAVWKLLELYTLADLVTQDGESAPEFRIGPNAHEWITSNRVNRLRERSSETYFLPRIDANPKVIDITS